MNLAPSLVEMCSCTKLGAGPGLSLNLKPSFSFRNISVSMPVLQSPKEAPSPRVALVTKTDECSRFWFYFSAAGLVLWRHTRSGRPRRAVGLPERAGVGHTGPTGCGHGEPPLWRLCSCECSSHARQRLWRWVLGDWEHFFLFLVKHNTQFPLWFFHFLWVIRLLLFFCRVPRWSSEPPEWELSRFPGGLRHSGQFSCFVSFLTALVITIFLKVEYAFFDLANYPLGTNRPTLRVRGNRCAGWRRAVSSSPSSVFLLRCRTTRPSSRGSSCSAALTWPWDEMLSGSGWRREANQDFL